MKGYIIRRKSFRIYWRGNYALVEINVEIVNRELVIYLKTVKKWIEFRLYKRWR